MPTTFDEFVRSFSGKGQLDDQQASKYFERFVSTRPEDSEFDNQALHQGAGEYLGQMPPDQFNQAAQNAFNQAQPNQRQDLIGSLMGALSGHGLNLASLGSKLGIQSTNPQQMGADDYARLANFARTNHPEVMQNHVQSQPWLVKALGKSVMLGVLGLVASKMLHPHPH